jgi:hypothetical protein
MDAVSRNCQAPFYHTASGAKACYTGTCSLLEGTTLDQDAPLRLIVNYQAAFGTTPAYVLKAPGREFWIAAETTDTGVMDLRAPDLDGAAVFHRRSARDLHTVRGRPLPRWARLAARVLLALHTPGGTGCRAVLVGEEPAGPRYDYALAMAFATFCLAMAEQPCDDAAVADVMEKVRRQVGGAGV